MAMLPSIITGGSATTRSTESVRPKARITIENSVRAPTRAKAVSRCSARSQSSKLTARNLPNHRRFATRPAADVGEYGAMQVTMLLADFAQVSDGKLNVIGGGWSMTG